MATSVCSDEIVRTVTNFRDYLGSDSPFQLGGLAGYPFTGLTGLKAFAAHVPDGGSTIIQYGPHIGVSKTGEVGTIQRLGQLHESSCCGALQATLAALEGESEPADQELDFQLWKIEKELGGQREAILDHPIPLVAATDQMFDLIDRTIHSMIKASSDLLKGHRIALIGGIIINTDYNLPDWFDLRNFEVLEL